MADQLVDDIDEVLRSKATDAFKPRLDANSRVNPATVGAPGAPTITDDLNRLIARHEQTIVFLKAIRDTL